MVQTSSWFILVHGTNEVMIHTGSWYKRGHGSWYKRVHGSWYKRVRGSWYKGVHGTNEPPWSSYQEQTIEDGNGIRRHGEHTACTGCDRDATPVQREKILTERCCIKKRKKKNA